MGQKRMHGLLAGVLVAVSGLAVAMPSVARAEEVRTPAAAESKTVGLIELHGELSEMPHPLAWLMGSEDHMTLRDVIGLLHDVRDDDNVNGLVIRLRDCKLSLTQCEELGSVISTIRASGKKVHLFADNYETTEMVLGSYCDEILIQAGGGVSVPGMYMEEMYLADTMAWAGLTPQMVQVGDYKGANEQYMRTAPSPQWDQNISSLLDGLYGNVRDRIKKGRKLSDTQLDDAMRQSWMALAETGKKAGLVDEAVDLPGLTKHLERTYGSDLKWDTFATKSEGMALDTSNPFAIFSKLTKEPSNSPSRDAIAIVHVNGPIVDGESTSGGFMGESSVGSYTIRRALSEIEDEDLFKGVVVRIDSPGGSAIASEVIWQGLNRLSQKKPVWVSVGSMAASGGYYCLVGGQKVYVNPSSIVGSIGVVGGKIAMTGLYDKLKIHVHGRERGPMGRMLASSTPWTTDEQKLVRDKMSETYELFTKRVSEGRKGIELSRTAEGRLFTGADAIKLNMADKLGGLDDCVRDLAAELKLTEGDYQILEFPGPKSLPEILGETFGGMAAAPNVAQKFGEQAGPAMLFGPVKELVGERHWRQIRDHMAAFMQLRKEPVILTSPRAIIVK